MTATAGAGGHAENTEVNFDEDAGEGEDAAGSGGLI
jgi:hypothetical protein